jgi:hypothetical protein
MGPFMTDDAWGQRGVLEMLMPLHGGAEVLRRPASPPEGMRGDGVPLPRRVVCN